MVNKHGVFHGQVHNTWRWYVIDPRADFAEVEQRWRAANDATNASRTRRVVASTLAWSTFVSIMAAVGAGTFRGTTAIRSRTVAACVGIVSGGVGLLVGGIGGGLAAASVSGAVRRDFDTTSAEIDDVIAIDDSVLTWLLPGVDPQATISTDADAAIAASPYASSLGATGLWELTVAVHRVISARQLVTADAWDEYADERRHRAEWMFDDVTGPAGRAQLEAELARLLEVASQFDFPVPPHLIADPAEDRPDDPGR